MVKKMVNKYCFWNNIDYDNDLYDKLNKLAKDKNSSNNLKEKSIFMIFIIYRAIKSWYLQSLSSVRWVWFIW